MLQLEFDRRELNRIASNAKEAFTTVGGDRRRWSYVYAPDGDFMGLVQNSLPAFWTERLSHIFASATGTAPRPPQKTSLGERIEKAKELKRQGLSLGQIARLMGVTKPTIKNWLDDYPYRRELRRGSRDGCTKTLLLASSWHT